MFERSQFSSCTASEKATVLNLCDLGAHYVSKQGYKARELTKNI